MTAQTPAQTPAGTAASAAAADRPLVSLLLMGYNQADTIAAAVRGALARTYTPLEIIVSDDASADTTGEAIRAAVTGYGGPHRVRVNRNQRNLGIGAHVAHLVDLSRGELIVIAAGDDVSLPQRCQRCVDAWLESGRRIDLIASALEDVDADGRIHGTLVPDDLAAYRGLADWVARPPYVIGAAQAWTRRLWDRFGPLPAGVVAKDRVMVFHAICLAPGGGGALTLREPLVRYRPGGISRPVRARQAGDVVVRMLKNSRHAQIELRQMLADAERMGQLATVAPTLERELARECFVQAIVEAGTLGERFSAAARAGQVPLALRLRLLVYAAFPALLAPFFWLKRLRHR